MIKSPILLAVTLLLATLIAVGYQVVELNRLRLKNMNAKVQPLDASRDRQNAATQKLPSLAELAGLNLMGSANRPVEKTVIENVAPISALNLVLIGTIVKSDQDNSSALIQRSNRETKRYFVGDMIEGGVALSSVAVDWVVLKRDDASEVLRYPQAAFSAVTPNMSSVLPASSPVAPNPAALERMRAAAASQANNAAGNSMNNSSANNPAVNKAPSLGGSRRLMNLRDRLKQVPANQQQAPAQQQTAPEQGTSSGDASSEQGDAK